jgi:hypothetical protein
MMHVEEFSNALSTFYLTNSFSSASGLDIISSSYRALFQAKSEIKNAQPLRGHPSIEPREEVVLKTDIGAEI